VLTRRLSLKLLAPTVVLSLLLCATCSAGALYINYLHLDVSRILSEHVESALAAQKMVVMIEDTVQLLREERLPQPRRDEQVEERFRQAREQLASNWNLANLERERELVARINEGLDEGWSIWQKDSHPLDSVAAAELAHLLETRVLNPCRELLRYNTDQVSAAEADNRRITEWLTWGLVVVGVGAPLSGLWLGYLVARSLYRSICQLRVRIKDAAGRLSSELARVTLEDPDDLHDLHNQMQGVVEQIEQVIERLSQSERAVLRSEQLAAVGQVAAGVAHELRNPLTSVKMLVQTGLEGPSPSGLPPDDLRIIEHEVRRMESCIQTFLDFARPPSCERRRCDLVVVLHRALALVEGRARRQKVVCIHEFSPEPLLLEIDAEQIQQVLVNLLLNALDALPQGGTIQVGLQRPDLHHPFATVSVRDTGPGIPSRIHDRLFEPFVSGKETGLGLGLSICYRLIEAHGGTIQGVNHPDGGALFTFTLPTLMRG
jgi:signal transduction histidine kinase